MAMLNIRKVLFQSKLAIVLQLIDSYTGGPPVGKQIKVSLAEVQQKPIVKADGIYLFTDLPSGTYRILIEAENYLSEWLDVQLPEDRAAEQQHSIVKISLTPNASYPVHSGATIIRARLCDSKQHSLSGVRVRAIPLTRECTIAKLAQERVERGSTTFSFMQMTGRLTAGDVFLIRDVGAKKEELCRVDEIRHDLKSIKLEQPLKNEYERGSYLLPVVQGCSDHHGELLLLFRNSRIRSYETKLEIMFLHHLLVKEVRLSIGDIHQLGSIELPI